MLRASIDLGTNTCLLLIAECNPINGNLEKVVHDISHIVRLGQGVDHSKILTSEAMERTLACLKKYAALICEAGIDPASVVAVATSQARDAQNGGVFFDRVSRETGLRFQVLSGDQEAEATFLGGLFSDSLPHKTVVIDIGGGSTELMTRRLSGEYSGMSLDMGAVRFTERYLHSDPVIDQEFWQCQESIDNLLNSAAKWRASLQAQEPIQLIAVAGTATALAAWHLELKNFNSDLINGLNLTRGDIHRMVEELKWRSVAERRELRGIEKGRADVLLAGALILWRVMEAMQFAKCKISTQGLRYGVLRVPYLQA